MSTDLLTRFDAAVTALGLDSPVDHSRCYGCGRPLGTCRAPLTCEEWADHWAERRHERRLGTERDQMEREADARW